MKTALAILLAAVAAAASPAAAQDFGRPPPVGPYGYDDPPIPPRPVPGYGGATETVTVTTRRIVAAPYGGYGAGYGGPYGAYGAPQAVVTTRRVVAPAPVPEEWDDGIATGSLRPAAYPLPPRRVLKSGPDYGPSPVAAPFVRERVVVRRAEPVVVEERRVVTTRRILHPAPAETFWDE
jgi:hypothetical protein